MKTLMRSTLAGLAMVALLVGGGLPSANAVDSLDPSPEVTEQTGDPESNAENEDTLPDGHDEQENSDNDVSESPEPSEADSSADETEGSSSDPLTEDDVSVADDVAEVVTVPETVEVTGRLRVFPAEPTQESIERLAKAEAKKKKNGANKRKAPKEIPIEDQRFELNPEDVPDDSSTVELIEDEEPLDMVPGMVILETAEGDRLTLDPESVDDSVVSGSTFTGSIEMNSAAQAAVSEAIVESPEQALTEPEVIQVAAEASIAADETFTVLNTEVISLPTPTALSSTVMHSADVLFITIAASSQETAVREIMTLTSEYWKRETAGIVAGIRVNSFKQEKPGTLDMCNWDAGFKRGNAAYPDSDFYSGARHLVVLVDAKCAGSTAGRGDIYTLHGGGETWSNLGARRSADPLKDAVSIVQHEIGHNLGLSHSGARTCGDYRVSDTAVSSTWFDVTGGSTSGKLCQDSQYGDAWGVMGYYNSQSDSNSPSLPMIQKQKLGVLPAGSLLDAKQANGVTQRFTIKALSSNAGVRGVRVQQSDSSEQFYIEYRNGVGADSRINTLDANGRGVRIHKSRGAYSIEIRTPAKMNLRAGQSLHPYGGRARVTVESMTSAQAVVRVDFYTSFTDVMSNDRFAGDIQWMYQSKISTGSMQVDKSVVYGPKVNMSREAVAAFFFRGYAPATYKPGAKGKLPFTDVSTSHKFYKEIYWMWERGITTGTKQANGTVKYLPGDPLSREAMAAFIYRVKGANYTPPAKSPFADVSTTSQFYKHIAWMYAKGVSTGTVTTSGRIFEPKINTTREATAPFMRRASQI